MSKKIKNLADKRREIRSEHITVMGISAAMGIAIDLAFRGADENGMFKVTEEWYSQVTGIADLLDNLFRQEPESTARD